MAERPATSLCSEEHIQSMVRNIFGELFEAERTGQIRDSSAQHTNVASEINQRFRLPRNNLRPQTQNVNTLPSGPNESSRTGCSVGGSSQGIPNISQTLSTAVPSFNPQLNYGNRPSVVGSGPVRPRRSENRRRHVYRRNDRGSNTQSSSTSVNERNEIFMKDVCVLQKGCNKIPRREAKTKLQNEGCYVDAFIFDKRWDEQALRLKILHLFSNVLDSEKSFDFVKSSGTSVVPINLPEQQTMNGRVLKHIAGNGPVYIRSRSSDVFEDEDGYSSNEDELLPTTFKMPSHNDIRSYIESERPHSSQQSPHPHTTENIPDVASEAAACSSNVNCAHSVAETSKSSGRENVASTSCNNSTVTLIHATNKCEEIIKEMFPFLEQEKITKALMVSNMNVEEAINIILGQTDEAVPVDDDNSDIEELMNSPLINTSVFDEKENGLRNLQNFISTAVNKFALELEVHIDRNADILHQVIRKYKNPAFDITKPLSISFTDEPGLDGGGLTREYFYLLMQRLRKQCGSLDLLEGSDGNLVPMHNYDILSGGLFLLLGKMIVHSILNNCTGLPGLSPAIVAYLVSGCRDAAIEQLTIEDLPDPVYQDKLRQLLSCNEESLHEFTNPGSSLDISDLLMSAGYPHITVTAQRRRLAYECCLVHEVITKRIPALDDIRKGLGSVKVLGRSTLDILDKWPELKAKFFPVPEAEVIDVTKLRSRYLYGENCDDSARQQAKLFFEKYLDELSERDGSRNILSDLVLFWTGSPSLPFNNSMMVVKYSEEKQSKALPEANTCPMVLLIPTIHAIYGDFSTAMDTALACGKHGFGKM